MTATFSVDQAFPLLTLETNNLIVQDNTNYGGNANGLIQVNSVTVDVVTVAIGNNYLFTWRDEDGNRIADTDNKLADLPAGTYTVVATQIVTGCVSEIAEINVSDQSAILVVAVEGLTASTYCDG